MKNCIVCKGELEKLFTINNMPSSAQDIPSAENLDKDKGIDISLCHCKACGLVQLDCEPVFYYKDVIRAGGLSTTMDKLRRSQYDEFISLCNLNNQKILELGCGGGEFLGILKDYPVKAYGVEHSEKLVRKALENGLNVDRDFPESENHIFKNAPFKAFTSFNFLEHQPKPLTYLRAIYNNLEEEAYGLITVPSFEYIVEQESFYEIIPDHIAYYSMDSLKTLLANAGFDVLKEERVNRDTLAVIVAKKRKPDVSAIVRQKEDIKKETYKLIETYKNNNKKIAIWGASHQGFTLCATLDLKDKIEFIIDSAPFKQGLYAPASHIKIISPLDAAKTDISAILIVAPGYTKEIAGNIKQVFNKQIDIYTLMTNHIERYLGE